MNRFARGIVATIVGASLWGLSGVFAQYLYAHYEITALFVTAVRTVSAGLVFLLYFLWRRRDLLRELLGDRASVRQLLVFGCCGLYTCQLTYIVAVGFTNAGTATVMQSSSVVFVMLATCLIGRRLPHAREVAGLVCAFAAAVLIATKGDLGTLQIPVPGLVWGILNALSVTFYIMYPHRLFERWGSLPITGLGLLVGGVLALVVWLAAGALWGATDGALGVSAAVPAFGWDGVACLAGIAVVGTLMAFSLYLHGVSIVGGLTGSLLGTMEPLSANVLAVLWLNTPFTWADWVGLALMLVTTALVSLGGAQGSGEAAPGAGGASAAEGAPASEAGEA